MVEHAAECVAHRRGDLDPLVVVDDEVFDVGDEDRGLGTVGAFLVPAETDEVRVDVAVAGTGVVDHQP
ncbi:hypothetical protein ACIGEP_01715 [Microbacterium sp. NPDC077663]|uniref:hypothetical protein n=1 Tax=Microbacterium sp. NPDC077663 TaxID=3364189 RepID=UPI0037CAE273